MSKILTGAGKLAPAPVILTAAKLFGISNLKSQNLPVLCRGCYIKEITDDKRSIVQFMISNLVVKLPIKENTALRAIKNTEWANVEVSYNFYETALSEWGV